MSRLSLAFVAALAVAGAVAAQQPPTVASQAPAQRPFGFSEPDPLNYADYTGWTSLFDGATLSGWDGRPGVWTVADGAITATSACEHPIGTTYLIWQGGEVGDFELKAEIKGEGPDINSGIQYRSAVQAPAPRPAQPRVPQPPCASGQPRGQADPAANAKWNLIGPQFDFDGSNRYPGQYYQSGAPPRFIEAFRGQVVEANEGQASSLIGSLGDRDALGGYVHVNNWNQIHIIARGHTLVHILNGHVMSIFVDNDPARFRPRGVIGLQIEGLGSISFRNIYLKKGDAGAAAPTAATAAYTLRPAAAVAQPAARSRGPESFDFDDRADRASWQTIFDGTSLADWDGNPSVWHLDSAAKTVWAESTCEHPTGTTYDIWKMGEPADFELKTEMKLEGNVNSGFQYRSFLNPAASAPPGAPRPPEGPCPSGQPRGEPPTPSSNRWNVGGYQFDFDYTNAFSGQVYEGGTGRGIIAWRGQMVRTEAGRHPRLVASVGDRAELAGFIHVNDWNQVHVLARGSVLIHILNGRVTAILLDDDTTMVKARGILALQIENLGKVSYRNIRVKRY